MCLRVDRVEKSEKKKKRKRMKGHVYMSDRGVRCNNEIFFFLNFF